MVNPAAFLAHQDQLRTVRSIKDVNGDGSFYTMEYFSDYQLDQVLEAGASDAAELRAVLQKLLLAGRLPAAGFGAGCSIFMARNTEGHVLVGRNFDFRHETSVLLLRTAPAGDFRSFGLMDLNFVDLKPGLLSDGRTDLSVAIMFPYLTMDGLNEKGLFIGVLQLRSTGTCQDTGKTKITSGTAIRAVLDRAETVRDAVGIFSAYDMHSPFPSSDYHYFVADRNGDAVVIEYFREEMNVIAADRVTNFFLSPGARRRGRGKERYAVMDALLRFRRGVLEKQDVMEVLRLISQPAAPSVKSRTLWSAVYDLTDGSLDLAVGGQYHAVRHYSL